MSTIHAYKYTNKGWKFLKSATTIGKAKKIEGAVPSVTTVLKMMPPVSVRTPEGFEPYGDYRMWLGGRDGLNYQQTKEAMFGYRKCPETGQMITSSDFGTLAHACMEDWANGKDSRDNPYHDVTAGARDAVVNLLDAGSDRFCETIVGVTKAEWGGSAGSVDLLGIQDGKYVLIDYKFRQCKGRGKFYEKDLSQLSIEARWTAWMMHLDYLPKIYSICIDCDTGKAYVRKWKPEDQVKGEEIFQACRVLYKHTYKF